MDPFEPWLRALRAAGKGPVDLPSAVRGQRWSTQVRVPGLFGADALSGGVSVFPGALMREASFSVTGHSQADGKTMWTVSLAAGSAANSTGSLPLDDDFDGVTRLTFQLDLDPADGGGPEILFGGTYLLLEHA